MRAITAVTLRVAGCGAMSSLDRGGPSMGAGDAGPGDPGSDGALRDSGAVGEPPDLPDRERWSPEAAGARKRLLVACSVVLAGCGARARVLPAVDAGSEPAVDASADAGGRCAEGGGLHLAGELRPPSFAAGLDHILNVVSADFDGDGDQDLVASDREAGTLALLRNDGSGGFLEPTAIAGGAPWYLPEVAAVDLDDDGDADLVVAAYFNGEPDGEPNKLLFLVDVLSNDGTGRFSIETIASSVGPPLAVGDVDGDGSPDLILGQPDLSVLMNDGTGSFGAVEPTGLGQQVSLVTPVDLDGDRDLDLLVCVVRDKKTGELATFVAPNVRGTFEIAEPAISASCSAFVAADIDGDGDPDLATTRYGLPWGSVVTYENDGTGQLRETPQAAEVLESFWYLDAADLDGDGDQDLVGATGPGGLHVLENDGSGGFTTRKHAIGESAGAPAIADFDGDGALDLAFPAETGVLVLANEGGRFPLASFLAGHAPEHMVSADLDGDGDDDLVTANSRSHDATILANDGGDFSRHLSLATGDTTPQGGRYQRVEGVAAADLDGDGTLDLALASESLGAVFIFLGRGDLEYEEVGGWYPRRDAIPPEGQTPESLAAGDLDADGDIDLVTADGEGSRTITVLENDGAAGFSPAVQVPVGSDPETVVLADVDLDGDLDIAVAIEGSPAIAVILVNDGLDLDLAAEYPTPGVPDALAFGDLDGDGAPELVVANYTRIDPPEAWDQVSVFWNDGAGVFGRRTEHTVGTKPRAVLVGDVDLDGDLDVATANAGSNDVSVLLNEAGVLVEAVTLVAGSEPMGLVLGQLDGRCGLDLAVTGKSSGDVLVIRSD